MLTGSVAMTFYTIPRATRDFDFVVLLTAKDVFKFVTYFSVDYYVSTEAVTDAIRSKSMFHVIDSSSGFKADFIILKDDAYTMFDRKRKEDFDGFPIYTITPEDLVLSKLV
ncbi:MAG TPA: hypothetical protein VM368_09985 [Flavisolibacter sp.]|nr:hypothetical protein [Flavisolibacter sp.]